MALDMAYFPGRVVRGREQLARYTMRYQESDLHLGIYSSLTSASNLNLLTLLTLSLTSSSIVVVFIAKAAHVWVS